MTTLATPELVLSPIYNIPQFFDRNGVLLAGGKIFTYLAGSSSTLATTYTDITGATANTNPIILDANGIKPNAIWLDASLSYNLVLTYPDGTTVINHVDNITGIGVQTTPTVGLVFEDINNNILGYSTMGVPNYAQIPQYVLVEFDENYDFAGWLSNAPRTDMSQIFTDPSGATIGFGFPKVAGYLELDDFYSTAICYVLIAQPAWGAYYELTDINNVGIGWVSATPTISMIDQLLDPNNKSIGWAVPPTSVYMPLQTPVLGPFSIGSELISTGSYPITPPTSTSPGAWSYTSSNPTVALISGTNIIPLTAGSVLVVATQAAAPGYFSDTTSTTFTALGPPIPPPAIETPIYDYNNTLIFHTYTIEPSSGSYIQLFDQSAVSLGWINTVIDISTTVPITDPLAATIGYALP